MSRGFGWALGVFLLIVLAVSIYRSKAAGAGNATGEVVSMDSGSSAAPPASTSPALTDPETTNIDGNRQAPPAAAVQPVPTRATALPAATPAAGRVQPAATPVSDTLTPDAPSGMAFGGKGRFQWYRQGNLTWRIDTVNGATCINFATMEEWSKPIVYMHGCRNIWLQSDATR